MYSIDINSISDVEVFYVDAPTEVDVTIDSYFVLGTHECTYNYYLRDSLGDEIASPPAILPTLDELTATLTIT